MSVNVKVELRINQAFSRLFDRGAKLYANTRLRAYCDPYVAFDTGNLSSNVTVTDEAVIYESPYAIYPYKGKNMNFTKDHHPLATAEWNKAMAVAKGQQLADDIQKYIERGGK